MLFPLRPNAPGARLYHPEHPGQATTGNPRPQSKNNPTRQRAASRYHYFIRDRRGVSRNKDWQAPVFPLGRPGNNLLAGYTVVQGPPCNALAENAGFHREEGHTMSGDFREALKNRRSCYELNNSSPIGNDQIREILEFALLNVPSSFNCQSTRLVLLLGVYHKRFWDIVLEALRNHVKPEEFEETKQRNDAFAAGYGTVLFYEDQGVVEELKKAFPGYSDKFGQWSDHTSAMHQLTVWTLLEEAGFGASLQHYNPLIDEKVGSIWHIDPKWRLIAQMPFGGITQKPAPKEKQPLTISLKVMQ
jgi:predicted oxidoreductase (fatty acid repression mutant protein)